MTCNRIAAVSALVAVLIGFAAGRWSAPEQPALVEDKSKRKEAEKTAWQGTAAATANTTAQAETKQQVRIVTRWLRPDGTTAKEQTTESGQQTTSRSDSAAVASGSASATAERTVEVVRERRVDLRPRWHLQAMGGVDLRWRRHWGAQVSVRVLGPVTAGVWAIPTARAGGVALGVTW